LKLQGLPWKLVWYVQGLLWKIIGYFASRNCFESDLLRPWYSKLTFENFSSLSAADLLEEEPDQIFTSPTSQLAIQSQLYAYFA